MRRAPWQKWKLCKCNAARKKVWCVRLALQIELFTSWILCNLSRWPRIVVSFILRTRPRAEVTFSTDLKSDIEVRLHPRMLPYHYHGLLLWGVLGRILSSIGNLRFLYHSNLLFESLSHGIFMCNRYWEFATLHSSIFNVFKSICKAWIAFVDDHGLHDNEITSRPATNVNTMKAILRLVGIGNARKTVLG